MTKLYKATKTISTVFFSDLSESIDSNQLRIQANKWIAEEEKNICWFGKVEVCEVSSLDDLPEEWKGGNMPWGGDKITCFEWFEIEPKLAKIIALKEQIAKLSAELNSLENK